MRLAGLFDDALGGILKGNQFGMVGNIAEQPTRGFGAVGQALLHDEKPFGVAGILSGHNTSLPESMGLQPMNGFSLFGQG